MKQMNLFAKQKENQMWRMKVWTQRGEREAERLGIGRLGLTYAPLIL